MLNKRIAALALVVVVASGASSLWSQVKHPEEGDDDRRLFPRRGNPDGTLNCVPSCGSIGPCC